MARNISGRSPVKRPEIIKQGIFKLAHFGLEAFSDKC
jgi:hypothetical protein